MGLGDVKLAALMGLYLGYLDPLLVVPGRARRLRARHRSPAASCSSSRGRASRAFPFGPWLALGCVLAIVFHESLIQG